jgi:hypothetical protein
VSSSVKSSKALLDDLESDRRGEGEALKSRDELRILTREVELKEGEHLVHPHRLATGEVSGGPVGE